MKTKVKVKVIKGFGLRLQGSYFEGDEVTLHFGRIQNVGVLTLKEYQRLLESGCIETIEEIAEEVSNGSIRV